MREQSANLEQWLKRSTKAGGVPFKVTDRAVLAALQGLMGTARRTQSLASTGPASARPVRPKPEQS
jgi:hypothetical protein